MNQNNQETTEAAVVQPVAGSTTISLNGPTPEWARKFVRACTWITGIWAVLSISINLQDFGISAHTELLILKYAPAFTALVSGAARFLGVKPVDLTDK